jgi:hypothetical protein
MGAIILPCILVFIIWRITLALRVHAKLKAIAEAGYPVSMADLERMYYPAINPADNAAVFICAAFVAPGLSNTAREVSTFWPPTGLLAAPILFSTDNERRMAELAETNRQVLELLRRIPPADKSRYPLGIGSEYITPLPHLGWLEACERVVLLDAVHEATENAPQNATEDVQSGLRLARSITDDPFLLSQLSRIHLHQMVSWSLERILGAGPLTDAQLREVSRGISTEEDPQAMARAFAGERCVGIHLHEMSAQEMAVAFHEQGGDDSSLHWLVHASGLSDLGLNRLLETMSDQITVNSLPFPQRLEAADRLDARVNESARPYYLWADSTLGGAFAVERREAIDIAILAITETALATERYRLLHEDQLPNRLEDLVPAFLADVPSDPFDGKPIRFKLRAKGYVIYSVGPDGVDNGGTPMKHPPPPGLQPSQEAYDIAFIVGR